MQTRPIVVRTEGQRHNWFKRLVSPSDLGELIKPFVFLDDFDVSPSALRGNGMHPHSGIATITVTVAGKLRYVDSTGASGILPTGGVEYMQAGGGVWHGGSAVEGANVRGFQLWIALPPEDENGAPFSRYLPPAEVAASGPARVVLGAYEGVTSPLVTRAAMNYLHVTLQDGERWSYQPPTGHDVAWVAPMFGKLHVSGAVLEGEIAVFAESEQRLDFVAEGDTEFVLGSAVKHPHDLVLGYYSVHSSAAALALGEAGIEKVGEQLSAA